MRRFLHAVLRVLDGAPRRETRGAQAGQSLVELAFITPLLAIMIVGTVEIGWYANHYLILLEVSRVGARSGTTLVGELSPLQWTESASVHPAVYIEGLAKTAADIPLDARDYRDCDQAANKQGFFNFVACTMINSLAPEVIKGRSPTSEIPGAPKNVYDRYGNIVQSIPYPDDIVISVFATQAVNNNVTSSIQMPNQKTEPRQFQLASALYQRTFNLSGIPVIATKYPAGSQVIVIGRYPKQANECNIYQVGSVATYIPGLDPFDYIENNARDPIPGTNRHYELEGYEPNLTNLETREAQLGFVWTAQHLRTDLTSKVGNHPALCWGSEYDIPEVEQLMNIPNFINSDVTGVKPWNQQRAALPSNGVVIVEIFWQHDILLDFPFIEPIVAMFGDTNNIIISSWAAFPVPAAEPNIIYNLPS